MLAIAFPMLFVSRHVALIGIVRGPALFLLTLARRLVLVAACPELKIVLVRIVWVLTTILIAGHLMVMRQSQLLMVLLLHGKGALAILRLHREYRPSFTWAALPALWIQPAL